MSDPPIHGPAQYFDAIRPVRRPVTVELGESALVIETEDGRPLAHWPLGSVRLQATQRGVARYMRLEGETPMLERLEIGDPVIEQAITRACPLLLRKPRTSSRMLLKISSLGGLAVLSLTLFVTFGIPALADWLGPLVPVPLEEKFGRAVEAQARFALKPQGGRFICDGPVAAKGRAVLANLVNRMTAAADFAVKPRVDVIDVGVPNAFALPGGHVFILRGLLDRARSADELAGVLAHELGHVYYRHGTRRVLQAGATSFLIGAALGDFSGSGAVAIVMQNLASAGYSREAEHDADLFAVDLMLKIGGDPRALGTILSRIAQDADEGRSYFASHPWTPDRVDAIRERAGSAVPAGPIMSAEDFAALRGICSLKP